MKKEVLEGPQTIEVAAAPPRDAQAAAQEDPWADERMKPENIGRWVDEKEHLWWRTAGARVVWTWLGALVLCAGLIIGSWPEFQAGLASALFVIAGASIFSSRHFWDWLDDRVYAQRAQRMQHLAGRHHAFGRVSLDFESTGSALWMKAQQVRAVLRRLPEDAALIDTFGKRCRVVVPQASRTGRRGPDVLWLEVGAVAEHLPRLVNSHDPRMLKFRRYLLGQVLAPWERRRGHGVRNADKRQGMGGLKGHGPVVDPVAAHALNDLPALRKAPPEDEPARRDLCA